VMAFMFTLASAENTRIAKATAKCRRIGLIMSSLPTIKARRYFLLP
jgi:hypothetical protein